MAKRNLAALMLASIAALALSLDARADQPFMGVDGCAALAQLVHFEVTAAAWHSPESVAPLAQYGFRNDISICNRTAQAVSKAFTLAIAGVGSEVRWSYPSGDPDDYCWNGFLDQCFPQRTASGALTRTWDAVSNTVRYAMPRGSASDRSVFSNGAMQLALRAALSREARDYWGLCGLAAAFNLRESQIPAMPMRGDVTSPGK